MTATAGRCLDDINQQIVEHLQRNGRKSYVTIAKSIGISEAAVRHRVQRLLDGGLLQIVAVADPRTLGYTRQAMVGIKVNGNLRDIARKIAEIPEVDYLVICAGGFDLLGELVCDDDDHLLDVLSKRVRAVEGVVACETFVYLKLAKRTFAWGMP